ncbi:MAG: hypothetical protein HOP29_00345 [Phycisphaerales bacterium]|nr:hypothetical protein [Phycisphaerales bacterium]
MNARMLQFAMAATVVLVSFTVVTAQTAGLEPASNRATAGTTPPSSPETTEICLYRFPQEPVFNPPAGNNVWEDEPNDSPAAAQFVAIQPGPGAGDVDVNGSIGHNADVDFYRITVSKGDILGLTIWGLSEPDTVLAITDSAGDVIVLNDDHYGFSHYYPSGSPLPQPVVAEDSILNWVAPQDGNYLIRASSDGVSAGQYTLLIRDRRAALETRPLPAIQLVYLDFDGETVNGQALFGGTASASAVLSPLSTFLPAFGLAPGNENAVIDAILQTVRQNFDDLRVADLNGDHPTDGIDGHYDVVFRNSRNHVDVFGLPDVSRVIIGGTQTQLGINVLGVAESVDPGNFRTDETAVVLLDALSGGLIANIPRAPGVTMVDAVGRVVGNIVSHELGHLLGNWHTEGTNVVASLMDVGGTVGKLYGGVGFDGVLGTADDTNPGFVSDIYRVIEAFDGDQRTDVRTAFALSTGPGCVGTAQCDDFNICTYDVWIVDQCQFGPALYGDVTHDGGVDIFDVLCALDAFAQVPGACTAADADIAMCARDCTVDVFDILAVLDAFGGVDPCCGR